ncbi:MAG: PPC domain-containing protein [Planctomycetes bacterium]|nr:PPC domain-containing protein [Planctomycetota bacterium]
MFVKRPVFLSLISLSCAAALALPAARSGAQVPAPPLPANPQAPTLAPVVPLGMQRGTKLELTLTGTNLAEPTGLWTSFPAKVTIPTDANNGKDNAKLRVVLEVHANAELGFHSLRLATTRGMSNLRPFCIDDLPQVMEEATNHAASTAQAVKVPCVVVGRADAEVSDYFKVSVKAGQRLSFDVLGRRLGSAFDPQLQLYDAQGHELSGGHSNDAPGLQTDPRLTYTFKEAGDYLVEVRDVSYHGGPDFHYRLRIGDFPCATTPYPLAVKRGSKTKVAFAGPAVEGVAAVDVAAPSDPLIHTLWLAPKGASGLHGWPVALALSDLNEVTEQEPNNELAKATRVQMPCGVSGRFLEKGDVDHYVFALKKGQRIAIEAQTQEWFSPTEVYMVLKDAKGGQLATNNPALPPRIDYTAPADGDLVLAVEHLHYWGGPEETYHLTIAPYEPSFDISVRLDRFDAAPGGTFSTPIFLTRREFAAPIEVSVLGSPNLTGKVTIPATAAPNPAAPVATLTVTVKPDAQMGPMPFLIQGKATVAGKTVVRTATARSVLNLTLANLPYPPPQYETNLGVAIKLKPPFTLAAKFDAPQTMPGQPITATVTAIRTPGFVDEIVLGVAGLPPTVKPMLKNIPKGQNEVKVQFVPVPKAPPGQFGVTFTGRARFQGADVSANTTPVSLVLALVPFDLKVEPALLQLATGAKAKLKVTATRRTYQGPIVVEVRNLPANVSATKATIAQGQVVAEVEVTAAGNAVAGNKADVQVAGIATAAGNATRLSPNFTLSVLKK